MNAPKKINGSDVYFSMRLYAWEREEVLTQFGKHIQDRSLFIATTKDFYYNSKERHEITALRFFLNQTIKKAINNPEFYLGRGEDKVVATPKKLVVWNKNKDVIFQYPAEGETITSQEAYNYGDAEAIRAERQMAFEELRNVIFNLKNIFPQTLAPQKPEPKKGNFSRPETPAAVPAEIPAAENPDLAKRTKEPQGVSSVMSQYIQSQKPKETPAEQPKENPAFADFRKLVGNILLAEIRKTPFNDDLGKFGEAFKKSIMIGYDADSKILHIESEPFDDAIIFLAAEKGNLPLEGVKFVKGGAK